MPVRVPLVTDPAVRVLLDGIVDYAALFPPASRPITEAVRRFARHRGGEAGWMLGRFVCPVAQFTDFAAVAEPLLPRDVGALPWRLAAIGTGEHRSDAAAIASLNDCHRWSWDECNAIVDVVETRASTPRDVLDIHEAFGPETVVYVEIPLGEDPAPFVEQLAHHGRRAKMRTGGVTADAIPPVEAVLAFMQACVQAGVPFKATAGLHHVVGGVYPLTYAADAPTGRLYGFMNIFLGASLLAVGAPADTVREALQETDAASLRFTAEALHWRDVAIDRTRLAHVREHVAVSFGSCSFSEPVAEVRAAGAW